MELKVQTFLPLNSKPNERKLDQLFYRSFFEPIKNKIISFSAHTPEEWEEMNGEKHPISGAFTMAYGVVIMVNCLD